MNLTLNQERKIIDLAKRYNLKFVILYGSKAKNRENIQSDIDIAILGEEVITFDILVDLNNEFAELFCVKNIDVKSLHNVDPLFLYEVTGNGVLLYGEDYDYNLYRSYAFRNYCDSRSLLVLKSEIVKRRLENLKKHKC